MKKTIYLLIFVVSALTSCKSRQFSRNNKQIEKEANKQTPNFTTYTTLAYIENFKGVAIEEMNAYGIPASITLAQGIIESGSGNSSLAKYANNHFGIKCTSDWKGKAYYKDDDQNNDCFRVYKDAKESFKDHSTFLKRKRYSFLFELDKNDYKNWAIGLKTAGYATNPKYPELLVNVIEKYSLFQYDQSETEKEKINREDRVFLEINANIPLENKKFTPVTVAPKDPPGSTEALKEAQYTVKPGDTLFKIAQLYKLTVDELKALNKLVDNNIKIGQKLLVVK
ncbi:MAG: glucosaminidase domain-containing protein [Bacteroidota bacterium]